MTATMGRFRVRGPLPEDVVRQDPPGTVYVRTTYDRLARASLEVTGDGYAVRYAAFNKALEAWRAVDDVARGFPAGHVGEAVRYFNSLALSPGYLGPTRVEPEPGEAAA